MNCVCVLCVCVCVWWGECCHTSLYKIGLPGRLLIIFLTSATVPCAGSYWVQVQQSALTEAELGKFSHKPQPTTPHWTYKLNTSHHRATQPPSHPHTPTHHHTITHHTTLGWNTCRCQLQFDYPAKCSWVKKTCSSIGSTEPPPSD